MTRNETRRGFIRTAAVTAASAAIVGVASADHDTASTVQVQESFTNSGRDWYVDSDMTSTADGSRPYEVSLVREGFYSESSAVSYEIDGSQDQGTVWIHSPVEIDPETAYEGEVSVNAHSDGQSYNKLSSLRVLVGPDQPQTTDDFPSERSSWFYHSEDGGLKANLWEEGGWNEYAKSWETPEYDTDQLHLAVGITTNWETDISHLVDDISLSLTPK